jgi:STE24 endopeptidase
VKAISRYGAVRSLLLAIAAAEISARLLSPRERPIKPAHVDLREHFSAEQIQRGTRYARPQLAIGLARSVVDAATMVWALRNVPDAIPNTSKRPVVVGALTAGGLTVAGALPTLPLSVLARKRAIAVGLITQSWRGWAVDLAKSTAIGAGLAAGAGAATVAVTRRYPRGWWLPAGAGSVVVGAAFAALAPVLLDPVFNDFTPLPEGETRSDVLKLAEAAGVRVGEVYSIDASRRTTAANAYVSGLGPTKRVVLFDTLLDRYSRDEVRVVVAHELGHVRHRDVARGVLFAAIVAPAAGLAVQRLSWALSPERGTPGALPALALSAGVVAAPIGLIARRVSRAFERRADEFSLQLSEASEAFISFERAIALQNVADLQPPKWVSALLSTHPPTAERIGAAVAYSRAGSAAVGAADTAG